MTVVYYDDDANPDVLSGKTIGVIGYGRQGRAAALNLLSNGIGVLASGTDADQNNALVDDIQIATPRNVTQQCDVLLLALPDETMPQLYMQDISPHLRRGHTLIFTSAYNIAFGFIEPPPFVDVGMVSPRTMNGAPALLYSKQHSALSFVAVWQDSSRHTWDTTLAVAWATGSLHAGAVEISIEQEAQLSLFVQQAVLPAFHHIMMTASQLLIKEGYPPEAALVDLYLAGKFSDYARQIAHNGLMPTLENATKTQQFGTLSRMDRFSELKLERLMEITLDEIRSGDFAQEWLREYTDGLPRLNKLLRQQAAVDVWELEQQTLDMLAPDDTQIF